MNKKLLIVIPPWLRFMGLNMLPNLKIDLANSIRLYICFRHKWATVPPCHVFNVATKQNRLNCMYRVSRQSEILNPRICLNLDCIQWALSE